MKASELIEKLREIVSSHGDLNLGFYTSFYGGCQRITSASVKEFKDGDPALGDVFIELE
jgi:hypothetical protein